MDVTMAAATRHTAAYMHGSRSKQRPSAAPATILTPPAEQQQQQQHKPQLPNIFRHCALLLLLLS
jgi:hypothetical protein